MLCSVGIRTLDSTTVDPDGSTGLWWPAMPPYFSFGIIYFNSNPYLNKCQFILRRHFKGVGVLKLITGLFN